MDELRVQALGGLACRDGNKGAIVAQTIQKFVLIWRFESIISLINFGFDRRGLWPIPLNRNCCDQIVNKERT